MFPTKLLASLTLVTAAAAALGCTTSHGRIYQSAEWTAAARAHSLGRVLVIVPKFGTDLGEDRPAKDEMIQSAIRAALAEFPATSVIDESETTSNHTAAATTVTAAREGPISEAQAIAAGQTLDAQTVCILTPGQFGGYYLLSLLPPGWDLRTTVQYAVRLIDVKSGAVLVDSVRERTSGGYLAITTATYAANLKDDLSSVLASKR